MKKGYQRSFISLRSLKKFKSFLQSFIANTVSIDHQFGICFNLSKLYNGKMKQETNIAYRFVEIYSIGWKHHTGCERGNIVPDNQWDGNWTGENLALRLDLCNYLIEQIDIELNTRKDKSKK